MAHRLHGLGNFWRTLGPVARLLFVGGYIFFGGAHDAFAIAMAGSTAAMIAGLIGYLVSAMKFGRPLLSRPEGMMEYALFSLNQMEEPPCRILIAIYYRLFCRRSLGIYSVAMRLAQAGLLPLQIVQRRLFPEYFVHGAQGLAAVVNFGVRNLWAQVAAALVAVTGILILAPILVQIFDVSSDDGVTVTRIVSITLVLYAIFYVAADINGFWAPILAKRGNYECCGVTFYLCLDSHDIRHSWCSLGLGLIYWGGNTVVLGNCCLFSEGTENFMTITQSSIMKNQSGDVEEKRTTFYSMVTISCRSYSSVCLTWEMRPSARSL